MNIIKTDIPEVVIVEPKVFGDNRGYFFESFSERDFAAAVREVRFVQDNESLSCYGVLRGLHFQKHPHAQSKLVRVVKGRVLDVAVDIRKGSPTFGKHVAVELSEENHRQLFIPRGFAHGFALDTTVSKAKPVAKDPRETKKESTFREKVASGFSSISSTISNSFKSLRNTFDGITDNISGAIGSVFGSGILGNVVGKAVGSAVKATTTLITKSIGTAMKATGSLFKNLVVGLLSNAPMTLTIIAIAGIVALIAYYSEEIWEAIKWLGYALDQFWDALTNIFTPSQSKYEIAKQELAEKYGVTPTVIEEKYGDTVRGRNQMYEDWKEIVKNGNEKLFEERRPQIVDAREKVNYRNMEFRSYLADIEAGRDLTGMQSSVTPVDQSVNSVAEWEATRKKLISIYGDIDSKSFAGDLERDIAPYREENRPEFSNTTVINNNKTEVNGSGFEAISTADPNGFSTVGGYQSQNNIDINKLVNG